MRLNKLVHISMEEVERKRIGGAVQGIAIDSPDDGRPYRVIVAIE